jgi:asparagine synthase (glutamine-hydrolysing)
MCGIHFILDKNSQLDMSPIQSMISSAHHRGPDDSGVKMFDLNGSKYFLGANKLNITDHTSNSSQPFIKEPGTSALIFNGEIYNYPDLKNDQLSRKISFQSSSDTEVLYHHLQQGDVTHLQDLQGMYSIICLDISTGTLLVARDQWGMKPLFKYEDDNYLIFSSEINGILASGLVRKILNKEAVSQYLKYRYVRRPETFFKGIDEVEPNTWMLFDLKGEALHGRIHESDPNTVDEFEGMAPLEIIDQLLTESILSHQSPTGSTGLFLSGGVDSTLLLAKQHELGIRQIPTFSFISSKEDKNYGTNDYKYARMAAKQYQSQHHEIETDRGVLENLDDFVKTKEASLSTNVVLSGAGADEIFGGYNRHKAFSHYLKNQSWLIPLRSAGKISGRMISSYNRSKGRLIQKYFDSISQSPTTTWDKMISLEEFEYSIKPNYSVKNFQQALDDDRHHYLINDVLAISDRMSMRASLEMRMPYLDDRLTKYVLSLPAESLISEGPKHLLRKLLSQKGGKVYTQREKEGFGLPFGGWIDKRKHGLWEFLEDKNHIVFNFVDASKVEKLIKEHTNIGSDHTLALWSIQILSRWLKSNFDL